MDQPPTEAVLVGLSGLVVVVAVSSPLAVPPGVVVLVSNEVGGGIVPDNALARRFRDEQGRLNQRLARVCDHVVLVTAGLLLQVKPAAAPRLTFPE